MSLAEVTDGRKAQAGLRDREGTVATSCARILMMLGLLLLIPGCSGDGSGSSRRVDATSRVNGLVLEDVKLTFRENILEGDECDVLGTVRNNTNKTLQDIFLAALNAEGTVVAAALVEDFAVVSLTFRTSPTVLPGESQSFSGYQLLGIHTCDEVVRIELQQATFE